MSSSSTTSRRVALVTGASRGIGRAIAIELGRVGYDVLINYRSNTAEAERTAEEVKAAGARGEIFAADVGNDADRQRLVSHTRDLFGRLDLLVNNAGIAPEKRVDLLETSAESFDRVLNVNLKGPFFLSQLVARWMIEQKHLPNYAPAIVNIGSVSAYAASPERAEYCVAKAGMAMMTKVFAARLADEGINVYEIRPGVIATDMTAAVKEKYDKQIADGLTPIKRWGTPQDVGRAVAAIAAGSFPFSTGEVINVDGGFHLRRL
ncbi:MAG TPA: 3-ketoacyl-ACP reductase [Pyrinomonadaceae bacterium]|jgi:3-oxoacyl-[acyl-carrier protein] reductase|nr:3-ketoacyl-ACP reductase [Pyrinomonadaceae bacterium]